MDQLMTWKATSGEKTRLKRQGTRACFIKTLVCLNLGVKYHRHRSVKDVQFSSGRSQNHYCPDDVVCVNIKSVLSAGARNRAIKSVVCGITEYQIIWHQLDVKNVFPHCRNTKEILSWIILLLKERWETGCNTLIESHHRKDHRGVTDIKLDKPTFISNDMKKENVSRSAKKLYYLLRELFPTMCD